MSWMTFLDPDGHPRDLLALLRTTRPDTTKHLRAEHFRPTQPDRATQGTGRHHPQRMSCEVVGQHTGDRTPEPRRLHSAVACKASTEALWGAAGRTRRRVAAEVTAGPPEPEPNAT